MKKIRRDDEVIVIAGKDKGKRGKVQTVRADGKLIVSGINMIRSIRSLTQCWVLLVVS